MCQQDGSAVKRTGLQPAIPGSNPANDIYRDLYQIKCKETNAIQKLCYVLLGIRTGLPGQLSTDNPPPPGQLRPDN